MSTTYRQRFADALTLLCQGRPPTDEMINDWIMHESDELQDFCASNGPDWCQGIVLIDAAHLMACEPEEGAGHLD